MDRREFLRLGAIAAGGLGLAACGKGGGPAPDAGQPSPLSSLADELRKAGARPGLNVFLGAGEIVAGRKQRIPIGLVLDGTDVVEGVARARLVTPDGASEPEVTIYESYRKPERARGFYRLTAAVPRARVVDLFVEIMNERGHFYGTAAFQPVAEAVSPQPGDDAPRTATPTFDRPRGVASVCTRRPRCPLHDRPLGDVLARGRPVVFSVGSPELCSSRTCGPVLDEVLFARDALGQGVRFVHAEPYASDDTTELSATAKAWRIPSEPYTWVIDGDGVVRDRFEGPVVASEIIDAVERL